ncbi:leucine rich repeat [Seminavis robusta]|uniref:Leucine rich repeat n=1 Tax=Seminavis robusta TaxID=568900 RepID=A0A9N8E3Z2_9STRA|nr:leucine rich repeat [Seminavis robusta]|eukprot:Sro594_g172440.1 leucine rich repeat (905) ;mRNA; r:20554-23268
MDRKNTKQFPTAGREPVVSAEEGELPDGAMGMDLVAGSEDLRLSKLVAARITPSTPATAFKVDRKNTKQFPAAGHESVVPEEEGEVLDGAFPMDNDLVDGSEDLRLSKLVAARLGETKEISCQNEHDMTTPSMTPTSMAPTRKEDVYAPTNGPLEDSNKPTKQEHDQFLLNEDKIEASNPSGMANASTNGPLEDPGEPTNPSHHPFLQFLLADENTDTSNPSGMMGSSGTNQGTEATSSGQQDSLPGAYAMAPSGTNNDGLNGVDHLPPNEHQSGVLTFDHCPTTASSNTSLVDGDIPVANIVGNDRDNTIPEATPEDLKAKDGRRKQRKRQLTRIGALSLAFFLIVLGLVLAIILFKVSKDQKTDIEGPVSTASPSVPPSMPPSQWRQGDIALQLISDYTNVMLDDLESAQYHAYQWLLDDIEMHENKLADERILQRFALATLYMATNGDSWSENDNWLNHSVHECFWYSNDYFLEDFDEEPYEYVQVVHPNPCEIPPTDNTDVSVLPEESENTYVHLWLANKELKGTIPPELFWLTHLRSISLYSNDGVWGSIPSLIGHLTNLEAINMGGTAISGLVPSELGLLSDTMHSIAIINALLEGSLPSELGLLHRMHDLLVDQNGLTGVVPDELGNASSLQWIYLNNNSFTGTFPVFMVHLPLQQLYLNGNQFSGAMPTEIGLLSEIKKFYVYGNRFTGTIPTQVAQMSSVSDLDFDDCYFTGTLPTELGLLTKMTNFWAAQNSLTGTISSEIAQNFNLSYFNVFENHLSGTIPADFGQISNLIDFQADSNELTGTIPALVAEGLSLENNNLSGSLPQGLSPSIEWLELSNNTLLTGPLPVGLTNLNWVFLTGTRISGVLPDYVCDIETLEFDCSSILCGCSCTCSNNSNSTAANILAKLSAKQLP